MATSEIQRILNSIMNSRYGVDVRQSIHDGISICYSDVTEGLTLAENAANNVNTAVDDAVNATAAAVNAVNLANNVVNSYNTADTAARSYLQQVNNLVTAAQDSADSAETYAERAKVYLNGGTVDNVHTDGVSSLSAQAAESAEAAAGSATSASNSATSASNSATSASNSAEAAAGSATSASNSATSASNSATAAETSANRAQLLLDGGTVGGTTIIGVSEYARRVSTAAESANDYAGAAHEYAYGIITNGVVTTKGAQQYAEDAQGALSQVIDSAEAAAASATSASNSATSASNSAGAAAASATSASNSAEDAAESAASASNSATAAETSANRAQVLLDGGTLDGTTIIGVSEYAGRASTAAGSANDYAGAAHEYAYGIITNGVVTTKGAQQYAEDAEDWANSAHDEITQSVASLIAEVSDYSESAAESARIASENSETIQSTYENIVGIKSEIEQLRTLVNGDADRAENATEDLDNVLDEMRETVVQMNEATDLATSAAETASGAVNTLSTYTSTFDTQINIIQTTLSSINGAVTDITNARYDIGTIIDEATPLVTQMEYYDNYWSEKEVDIDRAYLDLTEKIEAANTAAQEIEDMTVDSESVSSELSASAEISDVDGHKHIHFKIPKGKQGTSFIIKGHAYSTLEDLETDIENPEEGDLYNVGLSEPYDLYRWTGEQWENQGPVGVNIAELSSNDITTIYNGSSISSNEREYLDANGLAFYTNLIKQSLNDKVSTVDGKQLSTNDFDDVYKGYVDTNRQNIVVLSNAIVNKVDKSSFQIATINETRTYLGL